MNARRLAKLSAVIANQCLELTESSVLRKRFDAHTYWETSQNRTERWQKCLELFQQDLEDPNGHRPWHALKIVVEEVLFSEMLTRLWTAAITCSERDFAEDSEIEREMDSIVKAVWIGHLSARKRCLQIICQGIEEGDPTALELNDVRRIMERWTDIYLSRFTDAGDVRAFAFDIDRLNDWADRHDNELEQTERKWQLLNASFVKCLDQDRQENAANPELNRQLAVTVLACLPDNKDLAQTSSPQIVNRLNLAARRVEDLLSEYLVAMEA